MKNPTVKFSICGLVLLAGAANATDVSYDSSSATGTPAARSLLTAVFNSGARMDAINVAEVSVPTVDASKSDQTVALWSFDTGASASQYQITNLLVDGGQNSEYSATIAGTKPTDYSVTTSRAVVTDASATAYVAVGVHNANKITNGQHDVSLTLTKFTQ